MLILTIYKNLKNVELEKYHSNFVNIYIYIHFVLGYSWPNKKYLIEFCWQQHILVNKKYKKNKIMRNMLVNIIWFLKYKYSQTRLIFFGFEINLICNMYTICYIISNVIRNRSEYMEFDKINVTSVMDKGFWFTYYKNLSMLLSFLNIQKEKTYKF